MRKELHSACKTLWPKKYGPSPLWSMVGAASCCGDSFSSTGFRGITQLWKQEERKQRNDTKSGHSVLPSCLEPTGQAVVMPGSVWTHSVNTQEGEVLTQFSHDPVTVCASEIGNTYLDCCVCLEIIQICSPTFSFMLIGGNWYVGAGVHQTQRPFHAKLTGWMPSG